ncbi:MAG: hypothetical protein D6741_01740, partial [Planctomycetota bacterium]
MLDQAFEALKTFDWGSDYNALKPIDEAIVATAGDAAARKELETKLAEALKQDLSYAAQDFLFRKLRIVGTAASVPVIASFLTNEKTSHMARYALELMEVPEAAAALREALGKVSGKVRIGVISSLGDREDAEAVPALAALLSADAETAAAAAYALGNIGTVEAGKALVGATGVPAEAAEKVAHAALVCAEKLVKAGKKAEALAIYKKLAAQNLPKVSRNVSGAGSVSH